MHPHNLALAGILFDSIFVEEMEGYSFICLWQMACEDTCSDPADVFYGNGIGKTAYRSVGL
jgi:hypothetical protein